MAEKTGSFSGNFQQGIADREPPEQAAEEHTDWIEEAELAPTGNGSECSERDRTGTAEENVFDSNDHHRMTEQHSQHPKQVEQQAHWQPQQAGK